MSHSPLICPACIAHRPHTAADRPQHPPGAPGCEACRDWRRHTAEDRAYHPYMGHGRDQRGWSHPGLPEPPRTEVVF